MDPMDPVDPVEPLGPLDLLLGPVNLPLPQRRPGVSLPAMPAEAETDDVPPWHAEDVQTPQDTSHPDLLHRILRGLRRSDLRQDGMKPQIHAVHVHPAAWQAGPLARVGANERRHRPASSARRPPRPCGPDGH